MALIPSEIIRSSLEESEILEFKRELPTRDNRGKHEFLKDVCAMANRGGGSIFYGIDEVEGRASSIVPITDSNFDAEALRLGQLLSANVEPRLDGAKICRHDQDEGYILECQVPLSFDGPYRFKSNEKWFFVIRTNTHSDEMTYDQIRQAFLKRHGAIETVRSEWARTLEAVVEQKTWRTIGDGATAALQISPLNAAITANVIDVGAAEGIWSKFMLPDWGGASSAFNLDGLIVHAGGNQSPIRAFTEIHRTGHLKTYRHIGGLHGDKKFIPSQVLALWLKEALSRNIQNLIELQVPFPYVINFGILNTTEYRFAVRDAYHHFTPAYSDRPNLVLPELVIENGTPKTTLRILRTYLDLLWQAFDMASCDILDEAGQIIR